MMVLYIMMHTITKFSLHFLLLVYINIKFLAFHYFKLLKIICETKNIRLLYI